MWGKWGMRNNLVKSKSTNSPDEICKLFNDETLEVLQVIEFPINDKDKVFFCEHFI